MTNGATTAIASGFVKRALILDMCMVRDLPQKPYIIDPADSY
jgi:hypothetical protein